MVIARRQLLVVIVIALCAVSATASPHGQLGHEFLPPEHWANRALFRFEAMGLVHLPSYRPFQRDDVISFVQQIEERVSARNVTLSARDRFELKRLRMEFTDETGLRAPKSRFDPPLVFAEEDPLAVEFDIDLALAPVKPLFDERWWFFGISQPEMRLHIADLLTYEVRYRVTMGPERGNRSRDQKPTPRTKTFKGLTSLYERAYLAFRWKPITLFWGRDYEDWGPNTLGNPLLSETAGSLDKFGARLQFRNIALLSTHATLSQDPERRLSAHRLEVRFGDLLVGLAETAVYHGRGFDPVYLLPLSSFYANQFNERGDDNVLWLADAKYNILDGWLVYGSYMIDDFQFEREDGEPDKVAWDIGTRVAFGGRVPFTVRAGYRFVDIYTYTHRDSTPYLLYYLTGDGDPNAGNRPLGSAIGPDADEFHAFIDFYPVSTLTTTLLTAYARRGEGNDFRRFEVGDDTNPPFPSGVVEKTLSLGARVLWELPGNTRARGDVVAARVENVENVPGRDEWTHRVAFSLLYDF
jgi:hypothetical protein